MRISTSGNQKRRERERKKNKPKTSRRKGNIKVRTKINEVENRK